MSYGTLITARPGAEDQFHSLHSRAGESTPAHIFEVSTYFNSDQGRRMVVDGLGVPIGRMGEVDRAFGRFLKGIQDSSFIPRERALAPTLDDVDLTPDEIDVLRHTRCSTLSPDILRQSMRLHFARFVQDIAEVLQLAGKESLVSAQPTGAPVIGTALLVGVDISHTRDLNDADLLTPSTRLFLDGYGQGCADAVNSTLLLVGKAFLNRADLSRDSTRTDSKAFRPVEAEKRGVEVGDSYYSTLEPKDLIERAQESIRHCMSGLMMDLPRDVQDPILARLKRADEARSAASSAGSRA